ncbi:MAG: transcription termination factor NusA [Candidatus Aminicenantes bacterium]|nr:transcription termination factor NusA [Candidatus Aminicenantes bacterium]
MKINVWNTILQLSKERGVEPKAIVAAIEESLRVAAVRIYTKNEDVHISFKPEKGDLRVYCLKSVVETPSDASRELSPAEAQRLKTDAAVGDVIEIDLPSDTLGRIAAQAAKQVLVQKVRDAESEKIYDAFAARVGEIVTGTYRRVENGALVLDVNNLDVILPPWEIIPGETYDRGSQIRAVIIQVRRGQKGQETQILVSRASNEFLRRLLQTEIPEIGSGIIEIKDIVRQPGERAKVAVSSRERDVDPIGACIGPKGSRILAISKELGGEKIDVILWSPNPGVYAKAALSPARVEHVIPVNTADKSLEAVVAKDQLSLAIGKKGINVKLASKLTGWRIAIKETG